MTTIIPDDYDPYAAPVVDHSWAAAVVRGVRLPDGDRLELVVAGRVVAEVPVAVIKRELWKLQNG